MDYEVFKAAVDAAAKKNGLTDYELYYESVESTSVDIFKDEINNFTSNTEGGVCFRTLCGGKMGYASTENVRPESAEMLVRSAMENAAVLESEEQEFLGEGGQSYRNTDRAPLPLPSTEKLIGDACDLQKRMYARDPAVVDGTSSQAISERYEIAIFNSRGLDLHYENNMYVIGGDAVVEGKGEKTDGFHIATSKDGSLDLDTIAVKAVESAMNKLGGEVAPTGNYPVVFAPEAMASLLSTFSGIFVAENAQKGLSRLGGKEGKKIAAESLTLVDDPFYPENPMPMPFDAEGSPTFEKNVIENGVFQTLLYNLKTAAIAGKKTSGNAAKSGYAGTVGTSPFTMYVKPGTVSEKELLNHAGNGVYINFLGGLHAGANAVTGDFSLQSAGFLIENGQKGRPVKSFTVAGNFYDLLKNIREIASNVELPMAMGKTCFGSPSVLVEGLTVAGK